MDEKKLNALSTHMLVEAYNEMAVRIGLTPIKRFADRETGINRIKQLAKRMDLSALQLPASIRSDTPVRSDTPDRSDTMVPGPTKEKGEAACADEVKTSDQEAPDQATNTTNQPSANKTEPVGDQSPPAGSVDTGSTTGPVSIKQQYFDQFHARAGTKRYKLVQILCTNLNKPVAEGELIADVYGADIISGRSALSMVLKGVQWMIDKYNIGLEIRKSTHVSINHLGLFEKGRE